MAEKMQSEVLQEYVSSHGVTVRVDKTRGVLEGVKLIGLESRNGRRYRESALAKATPLYEEAKVNVNHPREGALAPRDYQDRLGVIRHVRLREGEGLFGDLHFNPKHALAEQLVWDAENNPRNVGFSHNVMARLSRQGEQTVVEEITRVQSVDLVSDPATTQGLFEQNEQDERVKQEVVPHWDVLTVETLRLHRPDLLEEIESIEIERLSAKLDDANGQSKTLQRRQRIVDLLCEHRLSPPVSKKQAHDKHESERPTISRSFFEMLMKLEDERQVEELIVERAELFCGTSNGQDRLAKRFAPKSRDQMSVFAMPTAENPTGQGFAQSLKSSCN